MRLLLTVLGVVFSVTQTCQIQNVWKLDNFRAASPIGDGVYNEVWGFVQNGKEYAVIGAMHGTFFFHITDDNNLDSIGYHDGVYSSYNVIHRDYHDYNGYLYEVCDEGSSTLRIYDLHYLPDSIPIVYDDSSLLVRSHNVFIDESSGLLYSCGNTSQSGADALRVISLQDPVNPTLIYDYNFVDYVHDIYVRNDTAFMNAGNQGLRVADFSIPTMPIAIGSMEFYADKGYNHSGWLSEDGNTYVMCDETVGSRFKVCDVSDLSDIKVTALDIPPTFENTVPHNVMLKDGIAYFSYYNDGFQVYDVRDINSPTRIAFYDTYPDEDTGTNVFRGAWGIYTLLPSGRLLVSDRKYGLFLLGYNAPPNIQVEENEHGVYPNPVQGEAFFYRKHLFESDYTIEIYNSQGESVKTFNGMTNHLFMDLTSLSAGNYFYRYYNSTTKVELSKKFIVIE
ncbi:MAG: choice-of-anchor B family protein [Flavobacteriales bacterium]|nr:choice-of-anchor B family protein [Flavobacteriales bacterium]